MGLKPDGLAKTPWSLYEWSAARKNLAMRALPIQRSPAAGTTIARGPLRAGVICAPTHMRTHDDAERRVATSRFIHQSSPKFIAAKTMGPYALPGSLRRKPMIPSNSCTRVIATASAATLARERNAIA
jgi:hypothetical protein